MWEGGEEEEILSPTESAEVAGKGGRKSVDWEDTKSPRVSRATDDEGGWGRKGTTQTTRATTVDVFCFSRITEKRPIEIQTGKN
jgi:hypothetical protein